MLENKDSLWLFYEHPSPMLIYDLDSLTIIDINQAAVETYGYSREEFVGLHLEKIRPASDIPHFKEMVQQVESNSSSEFGTHRHQTKNGEEFYVKLYSQPFPDSNQKARLVHITDISTTVEANQQLIQANRELNHHINTTPLAFVRLDNDFTVVEWSARAEELSGYTRDQMIGMPILDLEFWDSRNRTLIQRKLRQIKQGGRAGTQIETGIIDSSGEKKEIRIYPSSFHDQYDELTSIFLLIEDITERKQTERDLKKRTTFIEFLQQLSHTVSKCQSYDIALYITIAKICQFLDWPFGHVYVRGEEGVFVSDNISYIEEGSQFDKFQQTTSQTTFQPGKGFIGKILVEKRPLIVEDLPNLMEFIRPVNFDGLTIQNGIGIPVVTEDEIIAVLEFYTDQPINIEKKEVESFSTIGTHLGSVMNQIRTREQLQHSEHKFRRLFEESNDGIFLLKGLTFVECNPKVAEILGCSIDSVIGKSPLDFSPELQADGSRSDEIASVLNNRALEGENLVFDWQMRKVDGTLLDTEVSISKIVLHGEVYTQAIMRDVTDQKRAEYELKKREKLFRSLFLLAPAAIVMVDADNKVEMANDSFVELFGYSNQELEGRDLDRLIVPEDKYEVVPKMPAQNMATESLYHEGRRITKDGEEIYVFVGSIPVYIDGEPLAGFGIYIDITEQIDAQQRLEESLEEKQVLLAEIHHRVKNNLAVISGLLELRSMNVEDPELREAVRESQMRIHSMGLIHEKLYQSESFARLRFDQYVEELVDTIFKTMDVTDKQIDIDIRTEEVEININQAIPAALIINELVSNVLEHAFSDRKQGRLTIEITEVKGEITLLVEDNGTGLPEDFDLQSLQSLGFTLVDRLTKQLDGKMEFEGTGGTRCKISFLKSDHSGSSSQVMEYMPDS